MLNYKTKSLIFTIVSFIILHINILHSKPIIILDPGHGGKDKGAARNYFYEKYLALDVAMMIKAYLESNNYDVVMTRKEDYFVDLDRRVHIANKYKRKNAILVSIHFNSVYRKDYINGIETYWYGRDRRSKVLAYSIQNQLISDTRANNRGVKKNNFRVLRKTKIPSTLVELGFITNSKEREKIKYLSYRKKLAKAVFDGIENYVLLRKYNY